MANSNPFDPILYQTLVGIGKSAPRLKWYLTAIVALGALNYPEEIPKLYALLLSDQIPKPERKSETSKMREALTKVCGIQGAAKVSCHVLCGRFHHDDGHAEKKALDRKCPSSPSYSHSGRTNGLDLSPSR